MGLSVRRALLNPAVLVSALGYFVDIYDLVLFSIVRVASLKDLGVPENQLLDVGVRLLNMQMLGMLVGGLAWGIMGDRKGRISVLFGSILMYSLANIANAYVADTGWYAFLRFVAGFGLAGELGAAITLVSETLAKETRGYGTSFVAAVGVSGAMLAAMMAELATWKVAYLVGGGMGLALLVLRMSLFESTMFSAARNQEAPRGQFFMLLKDRKRLNLYVRCILIGMPTWYCIGILVTFSPEICRELGASGPVSAGSGILFAYGGMVLGDIASGLLSQWLRSRKIVVFLFVTAAMLVCGAYLSLRGQSPSTYYALFAVLGCFAGYWALFVTIAAEQFGTNLRATVATTVPNFIRGSVILLTFLLQSLKGTFGLTNSALIVGVMCFAVTFFAWWRLPETFGRDLDFLEI